MKCTKSNIPQMVRDHRFVKDKRDILNTNCQNWQVVAKWVLLADKRLKEIERAIVKSSTNVRPCWRVHVDGWTYITELDGNWPKTAIIFNGWKAVIVGRKFHYFENIPYGVSETNEPLPPRRGFWAK
jgi:hypothetical protein